MFGLHIVVTGNPVDGFSYIGTFKTGDDAVNWASRVLDDTEWWVASLEAQSEWER